MYRQPLATVGPKFCSTQTCGVPPLSWWSISLAPPLEILRTWIPGSIWFVVTRFMYGVMLFTWMFKSWERFGWTLRNVADANAWSLAVESVADVTVWRFA